MNIFLSQSSEVPLHQQLSEQIVFLITTGELRAGEEMPSVRALARRVSVHHNTVSKAYQELVRREWLTGKRGRRLVVGASVKQGQQPDPGLDELINETIRRAKGLGYSLQALRNRVRSRLLEEPADHLLVVEQEAGIRKIIQCEITEEISWRIEGCSYIDIVREPGLVIGAQVLTPTYMAADLGRFVPVQRPSICIDYSSAAAHLAAVRSLQEPSNIAVVSISESLLKTARSLIAPFIGREHTYQDLLVAADEPVEMRGADLVFCDSITWSLVSCNRKVLYRLVSADCVKEISMLFSPEG